MTLGNVLQDHVEGGEGEGELGLLAAGGEVEADVEGGGEAGDGEEEGEDRGGGGGEDGDEGVEGGVQTTCANH